MPYEPVAHGKLEGLDYRAPRPFMNWRRPDLLEKIQEWVALNPPRLELATLAYEELKNRGENRAKSALRLFPKHLPPIRGWPRRGKTRLQNSSHPQRLAPMDGST